MSVNLVVGIQEIPYAVKSELNYLEWYNFLRAMNINSPALTTILAPPYVEIVLPLHIMFLKDCLSLSTEGWMVVAVGFMCLSVLVIIGIIFLWRKQ